MHTKLLKPPVTHYLAIPFSPGGAVTVNNLHHTVKPRPCPPEQEDHTRSPSKVTFMWGSEEQLSLAAKWTR